jgi:hypothetical protein
VGRGVRDVLEVDVKKNGAMENLFFLSKIKWIIRIDRIY